MAVYMAACKPGDTILGMDLAHGGHLTHGNPLNFSGRYFKVVAYGVRKEDERIDYEAMAAPRPRAQAASIIVVGASAYPRIIDFAAVRKVADEGGAVLMADIAHIAGLVAAGLHPSPVPHAEFVTTTTHKTLRGPRGGMILCKEEWAKELDKPSSPASRAGRSCTSSPPRRWPSRRRSRPSSRPTRQQVVAEREGARRRPSLARATASSPAAPTTTSCSSTSSRAGITGKVAEKALDHAGITVNKNTIPFDTNRHGRLRHPHRHARPHHARHEGSGDGEDRPAHLAGPQGVDDETALAEVEARRGRLCAASPSTRSG